jgi:hypothetical protein
MTQLEEALRDFDPGDIAVPDLQAAAEQDPSALANQMLAALTEYENSSMDESDLRVRVAPLVPRGR